MMPNMLTTLSGFERSFVFELVKKVAVGGVLKESDAVKPTLFFDGVLEPIHSKDLLIKPEGQRSWKWWVLFTDLKLEVDNIIRDPEGKNFRIMTSEDWRQAGYFKYTLTETKSV